MSVIRAVTLVYCGISFALGCIYFLLASKKIKPVLHFLFSAISFAIPAYAVLTLLEYDAATLAEYDTYMRIQIWFTAALMALLVWFVWKLSGMKRPYFPAVFSAVVTVVTLSRFVHPFYLLYTRVNGLAEFTFLTGERVHILSGDVSPAYIGFLVLMSVGWCFPIIASVRMITRKNMRNGVYVLVSTMLLILLSANDIMVSSGLYSGIYLGELGLIGFVLIMGVGLVNDVVQKELVSSQLRHTWDMLEKIINNTPSIVLVHDPAGRILLANASAFAFADAPRPRGRDVSYATLENHTAINALLSPSAGEPGPQPARSLTRHLRVEGGEFVFLESVFPMPAEAGAPPNTGLVATDITELKKMEDNLRQAEKLSGLGLLAGGVAHDFNNQLTSLLGYAELIQDRADRDPMLAEYSRAVLKAVEHSREMTARLLAFARKGKTVVTPLRLDTLLKELAVRWERTVDKAITLCLELCPRPITVRGDRVQITQVLRNLAANAQDAMAGGGRLLIRLRKINLDRPAGLALPFPLPPGPYALVEFEDTGAGIAPEHLDHIFEPFFTTKPEGQGTGMGLAAAQGTVQLHNGSITVESRLREGTRVRVYLPVAAGEEPDTAFVPARSPVPRSCESVWVVDDEELIRGLIKSILSKEDIKVELWANGDEFLAALEVKHDAGVPGAQVVILDMVLPGQGSREIITRLRELYPGTPVILISGYTKGRNVGEIMSAGGIAFLQKPFRRQDLLSVMHEVLTVP
jgi:PAS domain S-box-containing protein